MLPSASNRTLEVPLARGVAAYLVTGLLLAAAWHVQFHYGLWIVNAIAAVVGIALARSALGPSWSAALGWSRRNAAIGIALGAVLVVATQVGARLLLPLLPPVLAETQRLYALLQGSLAPAQCAPVIALVAIAEELVFRGVVTTLCERRFGPRSTVALATALYVLPLAASGSWLLIAIGITLGAVWTIARLRSQSLLVPLLAHVIWAEATFVVMTVG